MRKVICNHFTQCREAPGVCPCYHLRAHSHHSIGCAQVRCNWIHRACSCIPITPKLRLKLGLEKL